MDFNAIAAKLRQIDEAPVPAIPGAPSEMPEPKPSISINMNAQGADGIHDLLKILADIDKDESDTGKELTIVPPGPGIDMDGESELAYDADEQEEAYANEPDEEIEDIDYLVNKLAGGMNRPKGTHTKVASADNPLQKIAPAESDLKTQIRAELMQRLQEAKEK